MPLPPLRKTLVIHPGALGDLIVSFPALSELKATSREVDLLCQQSLGKLTYELGLVDRWFALETARYASLYSQNPTPDVITMMRSYREIILFSRSEILIQTLRHCTRAKLYPVKPRPDHEASIHVATHLYDSLSAYGLITDKPQTASRFRFNRTDRKNQSKQVWIHPGSGSRKKMWPLSEFLTVGEQLISEHWEVGYVIGPAELFLEKPLLENTGSAARILRILDLVDLARLFKTGDAYIGNDSGPTHLAAFLQLPTVAVFGPSDPGRWHPLGYRVRVIAPDLKCKPCFETGQSVCKIPDCFAGITAKQVIDAFYQMVPGRLS